jgi:hypothetical protein
MNYDFRWQERSGGHFQAGTQDNIWWLWFWRERTKSQAGGYWMAKGQKFKLPWQF